jgi:uncharacterized integral membrane protein
MTTPPAPAARRNYGIRYFLVIFIVLVVFALIATFQPSLVFLHGDWDRWICGALIAFGLDRLFPKATV